MRLPVKYPKITLYTANCASNARNALYPNKTEVVDLDSFREAMAFDHVCAEYRSFHRSVEDFIAADCVMFDCDNTHSEDPSEWVSPEDVQAAFPGVGFYVCYSRNHNRPKDGKAPRPKFHVYFEIDAISDAGEYAGIKKKVVDRFPQLHFDVNARDAARFFFGYENPQVDFFEGRSHEAE